jgi:hypothetical protein
MRCKCVKALLSGIAEAIQLFHFSYFTTRLTYLCRRTALATAVTLGRCFSPFWLFLVVGHAANHRSA